MYSTIKVCKSPRKLAYENNRVCTSTCTIKYEYFTKRLYLRLYPKTLIPNNKYADRLGFFRLDPLEIHLIKKDLYILYRLVNGILEVPGVNVLRSPRLPASLQISSVRTTLYRSFYLHRTIMIWKKYL